MQNRLKENSWVNFGLVLLAVLTRIIPHPPNFVPIGGLALYSGVHFSGKKAYLIPILAMFISDLFLGVHSTMPFVYASFILTIFIGKQIRKRYHFAKLFLAAVSSSVLFFMITNFGVWLTTGFYPHSFSGLVNCYQMAIPFFRNTLAGDLFYSLSFFYGVDLISLLLKLLFGRIVNLRG